MALEIIKGVECQILFGESELVGDVILNDTKEIPLIKVWPRWHMEVRVYVRNKDRKSVLVCIERVTFGFACSFKVYDEQLRRDVVRWHFQGYCVPPNCKEENTQIELFDGNMQDWFPYNKKQGVPLERLTRRINQMLLELKSGEGLIVLFTENSEVPRDRPRNRLWQVIKE